MKDAEKIENWLSQLVNSYSWEKRKNWYGEVADAYNRVRPRYPQQLVDRAIELAQLPPDASILEIGCGPGTVTISFALLGFSMTCLEPSEESCQLARQKCTSYSNVEIKNSTFEDWNLESNRFHAVLAANSFHWISSEIRYHKAADALQDKGSLILLWNASAQPNDETYQLLHQVYKTLVPSLAEYHDIERKTHEESLKKFGRNALDSGLFKNLISEQLTWKATYSIDDYLALLSTYSPYIALESPQRDSLFESLRETLERNSLMIIETSYLSVLQVAQKV